MPPAAPPVNVAVPSSTLPLPASDPIVADVTGDGHLEILVCTHDGYLNILD